jgi:hypothetical protein
MIDCLLLVPESTNTSVGHQPGVLKMNSKHTMLSVYQNRTSFLETGTLYQSPQGLNIEEAVINKIFINNPEFIQKRNYLLMGHQ